MMYITPDSRENASYKTHGKSDSPHKQGYGLCWGCKIKLELEQKQGKAK